MRPVWNHLAPRLIVAFTLIVTAAAGLTGYLCAEAQERQLLHEAVQRADQLSRSITSATWHAMLADHRQDAYEVMRTMGEQQGIRRIRMIDKEGRIAFTTNGDVSEIVPTGSEACVVCHVNGEPLVRAEADERARFYRGEDGRRKLEMVTAIYNEPSCSTAACHAHSKDATMLGVLDMTLDLAHVDADLASMRQRRFLLTLGEIAVAAVFVTLFTTRFVSRPIGKLIEGTKAVSEMQLDRPIDVDARTELGDLAGSFNAMRERLKDALDDLSELTHNLERKVEERTEQLRATRESLIRSDRLASLGRLSASVAHEINNPISAVLNFSMMLQRMLREGRIPAGREEEFRGYLSRISEETARVGTIVKDLLAFSRPSAPQRADADLNEIVERALSLIRHKLELGNVTTKLELERGLSPVPCDRSQIQQVVVNLVMNAAEAMPDGGEVVIRTGRGAMLRDIVLEVEDSGSGIPADRIDRIFDPFYTTKEGSKGIGLGLAVVYGLVNAHGGSVDVRSQPGAGTVFTVRLPSQRATETGEEGGDDGS